MARTPNVYFISDDGEGYALLEKMRPGKGLDDISLKLAELGMKQCSRAEYRKRVRSVARKEKGG